MMYWFLLFLRVVSRAGLSLAVLLLLVSWTTSVEGSTEYGGLAIVGWLNTSNVNIWWAPEGERYGGDEVIDLPGIMLWSDGLRNVDVRISHWLLCLTFLTGTVATSGLWFRRPRKACREG